MATKKTTTTKAAAPKATKAAPKKTEAKAKAPQGEKKAAGPRHPKARADVAGGKASLAKSLASSLVTSNDSADAIEARLKTASNAQLLRLQKVVSTVKSKWGDRDKLIAAIGSARKKSNDKDYLNKLGTFSLPQLVDIANSQARATRS